MFGVFLWIVEQSLCKRVVSLFVARASRCAGNWVYICCVSFHTVVGFGRRSEDSERSEIKIKQIWRRIDAPQSTIKIEVVALVMLFEATRYHYLKNISAQTVLYSLANVFTMLVIGERTCCFAHRTERIYAHLVSVYCFYYLFCFVFAVSVERNDFHFVAEAFEYDDVPI